MGNIGNKIKQAIMEMGLNQGEFAKILNVKQPLISSWTTGNSAPRAASLKKIAQATGKPLQFFFDNAEPNQSASAPTNKENSVEIELLKKEIEALNIKYDNLKTKYDNLTLKIELIKRK
ncbi:MAG: helix-turn-helix domain-containing protein [Endomicrobium sp.]|jgi:transcriptional regulator with XRE-family HTH domain|nr:helix-turn-helix domain-containing protein [Endomicrobium sp.]